jgi:hypothetical protein
MMEILIKLTEDEQNLLLRHAGYYPDNGPWSSIAGKINRAREDEWALEFNVEEPKSPPCGICGIPKNMHQDARPEPDHNWQWLVKL